MANDDNQKPCKNAPCEKTLSKNSKFDFCTNCRGRIDFWSRRPPTAFLSRKNQLEVWGNRMDYARHPEAKAAKRKTPITRLRHLNG